jgi:hypothetical protein
MEEKYHDFNNATSHSPALLPHFIHWVKTKLRYYLAEEAALCASVLIIKDFGFVLKSFSAEVSVHRNVNCGDLSRVLVARACNPTHLGS